MTTTSSAGGAAPFVPSMNAAVVRYQVRDVSRSVEFYTRLLGFQLTQQFGPTIAIVSRGDLHLILSGPSASGSRSMIDGREQQPGGWNRIVLYVVDLESTIATLKAAGPASPRFLNEIEVGPGGSQILLEDADGNPVELHEPPKRENHPHH